MNDDFQRYPKCPVMSVTDWLITLLLLCIPIVSLVLLFVWGFGGDAPEEKRNWARAQLIIVAAETVLILVLSLLFGSILFSTFAYM